MQKQIIFLTKELQIKSVKQNIFLKVLFYIYSRRKRLLTNECHFTNCISPLNHQNLMKKIPWQLLHVRVWLFCYNVVFISQWNMTDCWISGDCVDTTTSTYWVLCNMYVSVRFSHCVFTFVVLDIVLYFLLLKKWQFCLFDFLSHVAGQADSIDT